MKVMLSGATAGTNFGDLLFAKMFQQHISEQIGEENVFWYSTRFSMSSFFKNSLNYSREGKTKDMDALVYVSGGYFCGDDKNLRDRILRVLRYFVVGLKCNFHKIPYCIIGLEVSDPKNKWLRWIEKKVLRDADLIVVRNHESIKCLESYGIDNAIETVDSAFSIESTLFEHIELPEDIKLCSKKILLLHINPGVGSNDNIKSRIVPIINTFLQQHKEYAVLVTADQYVDAQKDAVDDVCKQLKCDTVLRYYYSDPIALCKVIDRVDTIVTHKLHVGLVGARLGKSVISFSGHTEKIERLYKQLDASERSTALRDLDFETGVKILEKYYDKPINVSDLIISQAKSNFVFLSNFLDDVKKELQS